MSGTGYAVLNMVLVAVAFAGQETQADETMTLETLRQRVARNEGLIDPIRLDYTVKLVRTGERPQPSGARRSGRPYSHVNIVWAQHGDRQYVESHRFYGPNEPGRSELTVVDGRTRTRVDLPDRMRASVNAVSDTDWYYVLSAKLRLRPFEDHLLLSDVLVPPHAVLRPRTETVDGRLTYVVDVTRLDRYYCVRLWIDPETGLPMRAGVYDQHPTVPEAQPICEISGIGPYRMPNGGWIPVAGVRTVHFRRDRSPYSSHEHVTVDVASISTAGCDVPDSLFRIDLPEGARTYNALSGLTTTKGRTPKPGGRPAQGDGRCIVGTVVDSEGVPVVGAVVTPVAVVQQRGDGPGGRASLIQPHERISTTTDAEGRFVLQVERDGHHDLAFYHDGFADKRLGGVPPGEREIKVTLDKGGTVAGSVLHVENGAKTPLAGVEVSVRPEDPRLGARMRRVRMRAFTDDQGRFVIRGLPTQRQERPVSRSERPRYTALPWQIHCGRTSRTVTFERSGQVREVELLLKPDVQMAPSLIGRPLPALNALGLESPSKELEGRKALICFFEMTQRPSRHCVEQLAGEAGRLSENDVFIAAVQTADVGDEALARWIEDSGIDFPVSTVRADLLDVKYSFAIRSLPWLILADARHIVRAEGFPIDELAKHLESFAGD